eukprot:201811-Pyramimonas_sp.AAC.1
MMRFRREAGLASIPPIRFDPISMASDSDSIRRGIPIWVTVSAYSIFADSAADLTHPIHFDRLSDLSIRFWALLETV